MTTQKRIPKDATPDERQVFNAIWDVINKLSTENTNLNRRRFTNVHPAINRDEFITKGQLDDALKTLKKEVKAVATRRRGVTSGGTSGNPVPPSTGGLPKANHPIDFGYYYVDSKYGQYAGDVKGYTNLAYIGANNVLPTGSPASDVQAALGLAIGRLAGAGIGVILDVENGSLIQIKDSIAAAAPYWDKVKYLVANGDWGDTAAALNSLCNRVKTAVNTAGLEPRLVGVTFDGMTLSGGWWDASSLDFVLLECYSPDPNSHGTSKENTDRVADLVKTMKGIIPATKKLGLILQGYDRNGVFTPISPDLVDMQGASYMLGFEDQRVVIMLIFAYGRPGGTKDHPELKPPHQAIWNAIQGATGSGDDGGGGAGATDCGQGRPCCGGVTGSNCPRWCSGGDYEQQFFAAQGAYIASAPASVIDPSNRNIIIDSVAYMNGIVAQFNSDNPTLIAIFEPGNDGKQAAVKGKGDTTKSEHYKCWSGGGANTFVRYLYAATCYPARFEG